MNRRESKRITYVIKEALNKRGDLSLVSRVLINKSVSSNDRYDNFIQSELLLDNNKNFKVKVLKKKK